jgi:hypothetical protein
LPMKPNPSMKHTQQLPTARKIRRSCERELYRARKKLGQWIPQELVEQADEIYYKKVLLNLLWIHENGSNRRLLCDWWEENVCPELAELWGVPSEKLAKAFRDSFGG